MSSACAICMSPVRLATLATGISVNVYESAPVNHSRLVIYTDMLAMAQYVIRRMAQLAQAISPSNIELCLSYNSSNWLKLRRYRSGRHDAGSCRPYERGGMNSVTL